MAVLDVRFDIFLVRFDISRPIRHSVLPERNHSINNYNAAYYYAYPSP